MAQDVLVENQITDGQRLVEQLAQNDFPIASAFWVKTTEDGRWYFYIASPIVDTRKGRNAYGRVHTIIRQMPQPFWIDWLEVKLIDTRDPLAKAVREVQQRHPADHPIHFGETRLGDMSVEEAYIYPPLNGFAE